MLAFLSLKLVASLLPFQVLATLAGAASQLLLAGEIGLEARLVPVALQGLGFAVEFSGSAGLVSGADHLVDRKGFHELARILAGAGDVLRVLAVSSKNDTDAGSLPAAIDSAHFFKDGVGQGGNTAALAEAGDDVDAVEGGALAGFLVEAADLVEVVESSGGFEGGSRTGLAVGALDVTAIGKVHVLTVGALQAAKVAGVLGLDPALVYGRHHVDEVIPGALAGDHAAGNEFGGRGGDGGGECGRGGDGGGRSGVQVAKVEGGRGVGWGGGGGRVGTGGCKTRSGGWTVGGTGGWTGGGRDGVHQSGAGRMGDRGGITGAGTGTVGGERRWARAGGSGRGAGGAERWGVAGLHAGGS
mmetsp:Transcript_11803/g.24956  ORF Transcript_11803/g.24956 Transcript_11803/m.24956 type:complete len:357 (-) Transcript_11803:747-1817(-)